MMILKKKTFKPQVDPLLKAGDEAEKQMAFYLKREFGNAKDVFVINDLRIVHDGEVAQMDHLLVTKYGLFIVESKSVHGEVAFNQHGDWVRTYQGNRRGMRSPIKQAENQGKILKDLMLANKEKLLGTLLGMQKGFAHCPIEIRVAISDDGIIVRNRDYDEPKVLKADMIPASISQQLKEMKSVNSLLSLKLDPGWSMKPEEARRVADFLVACHHPLTKERNAKIGDKPANQPQPGFARSAGDICPKCQKLPLEQRKIKRIDGTGETDYLRCTGYPVCDGRISLDTMPISANGADVKVLDATISHDRTPSKERPKPKDGDACPHCKTGKLVYQEGRKGKSDFLGCSNFYSKPSCRFMEPLRNSDGSRKT